MVKLAAVAAVLALGFGGLATASSPVRPASAIGPWDWPTYGHDAQRTFHGRTTLTPEAAATLAPAWTHPTGLAVTATPAVVGGTVYVGSWDGTFRALDLRTGARRWQFSLDRQPGVRPPPTGPPAASSSGGIVTSSAWYEPGTAGRPDLVIFGGGHTLYALEAGTGALFWKHAYPGPADLPPDPDHDNARIFSSPLVVDGLVIFGISTEGRRGSRPRVVAADLATGRPRWTFVTDVDATGRVLDDGCGSVWSSGTYLPKSHLVVFNTADCRFSNPNPFDEVVFALHVDDGRLAWTFRPPRTDDKCDFDFGATANAGVTPGGVAHFLGVGGKDGTYYSLDPDSGRMRWASNVVYGGFAGGFIATAAYDGERVYGSTALGDFGRFESNGPAVCNPSDPRDTPFQEPTAHAFDARTGAIVHQATGSASFASTTVAGGMTFNCTALRNNLDVRRASDGALLRRVPLPVPCWAGAATVGDAVVIGLGASFNDVGSGVMVLTPGGRAPTVPDRAGPACADPPCRGGRPS